MRTDMSPDGLTELTPKTQLREGGLDRLREQLAEWWRSSRCSHICARLVSCT